jgi:hypothetical protein
MENNGWVEINLPWVDYESELPGCPEYPYDEIDEKIRAKFGGTEQELEEEFCKKHNLEHIFEFKREAASKDEIKEFNLFEDKIVEVMDWVADGCDNDPLITKYNAEFEEWTLKNDEYVKGNDFITSGWCRPGVLIEVKIDDKIVTHLIGTINTLCGVCDDCVAFNKKSIVLRAKEVFKYDNFLR